MHGILRPTRELADLAPPTLFDRVGGWARRNRFFLLLVVAPTLVVAGYYYLIASDQYMSEAHFLVRSPERKTAAVSGISQALGLAAGIGGGQNEAMSVNEYLRSSNAVDVLRRDYDLVARFNRADTDFLSRLGNANPAPETLSKFYRKHVDVVVDSDTGISAIVVRAFKPDDARAIVEALLKIGEARVNMLNTRSYRDSVSLARRELDQAEGEMTEIQKKMTSYRQAGGDIDPTGSAKAQVQLVTSLTGSLSEARARLGAMRGIISPSSPQYVALAAQVRALEGQVAAQDSVLTGGKNNIAQGLGGYEELQVRQEFIAKRYVAAAATYDAAKSDAIKQQLYVIRVVEPNLPVKSLYPERGRIVLTVFFALFVAYGIGSLVLTGIKEHSA